MRTLTKGNNFMTKITKKCSCKSSKASLSWHGSSKKDLVVLLEIAGREITLSPCDFLALMCLVKEVEFRIASVYFRDAAIRDYIDQHRN